MTQVNVLNMAGAVVGQIELDDYVFGIQPNASVVHQAVVAQQSNARRGTSDTQTRGEVSATGAKLFRQKGTGRARQGSKRAPHWKGGGVAFGPHPRSYHKAMPRKMRRLALRSALSSLVQDDKVTVLDKFAVSAPRTKEMTAALVGLGVQGKSMIVLGKMDEAVQKAGHNLSGLLTVTPGTMNLLDLLSRERVVITVEAVNAVTEWLGAGRATAPDAQPESGSVAGAE
jgi:large subunit ribosomal protein L4